MGFLTVGSLSYLMLVIAVFPSRFGGKVEPRGSDGVGGFDDLLRLVLWFSLKRWITLWIFTYDTKIFKIEKACRD